MVVEAHITFRQAKGERKFKLHNARSIGVEFLPEEDLNEAFPRFKQLADKKHEIFMAKARA